MKASRTMSATARTDGKDGTAATASDLCTGFNSDDWLTPEEFAGIYRVSARTVREWVKAGCIVGITRPRIMVRNLSDWEKHVLRDRGMIGPYPQAKMMTPRMMVQSADDAPRLTGRGRRAKRDRRSVTMWRLTSWLDGPDGPWHWPWIVTRLKLHYGPAKLAEMLNLPEDSRRVWKWADGGEKPSPFYRRRLLPLFRGLIEQGVVPGEIPTPFYRTPERVAATFLLWHRAARTHGKSGS